SDDCINSVSAQYGEPTAWSSCQCPQACYQERYAISSHHGAFPLQDAGLRECNCWLSGSQSADRSSHRLHGIAGEQDARRGAENDAVDVPVPVRRPDGLPPGDVRSRNSRDLHPLRHPRNHNADQGED
ncbi:hypothetical protein PMAYCL1PPCAC_27274, partial [Pristionchus mayeri]